METANNSGEVKNILHVIKSLGRGGAETLLPETLKCHNQNRYRFHYIYFLPWKNQMVTAIEEAGGIVTCLNARNNIQLMVRVRALARYIKKNNIHLVHCHLPWAGFLGRFLHLLTGIKLIYTEHNKQERYHPVTRSINKLSFGLQNLAIAVSIDVERSISRNIRPSVPVQTVLNGVNTQHFIRDQDARSAIRMELGIGEGDVVIGSIGVFRVQKRLDLWLEVFARVHAGFPFVKGVLVGAGPMDELLRKRRTELGLENAVAMPGLKTNSSAWLSAMDIFMMTSEFEGLPLALLEAMSCSCAVVTTDAGGIKEVIRSGVDGCMRSVDEWELLAEDLARVVNDRDLMLRLGAAGRTKVEKEFSIERMVSDLEKIYSEHVD